MRINDVRLANIEKIIRDECDNNKAAFARRIEMRAQAISKWWAKNESRNISDASAVLTEKAFALPEGWLDIPHTNEVNESQAAYSAMSRIPVKGTGQLDDDGYWDHIESSNADGFINIPTVDKDAYSLRLRGDSLRPAIKSGWYAVCEPGHELVLGEFVCVVAKDGRSMIKELLIYNKNQIVLDSVNEDHKRITFDPDEIKSIHYAFIVPPSKHSL